MRSSSIYTFLILASFALTPSLSAQPAPTLQALCDSALAHNISTRNARVEIASATEQRREAFTNYFPNVSGTAAWFNANKGMAKMDIDPSEYITPELGAALAQSFPAEALAALSSPMSMTMMKDGVIAGLTAIQPIFTGGQLLNGNKLAKIGEEAARLQLQLSEKDVVRQTEQYYWQLVSLHEKERTLAASDSLLAAVEADVETAVKAGLALRNDLLQVQLRQNEIESNRLKIRNGQALVGMLLAQFCGLKDSAPLLLIGEGSSLSREGDNTTATAQDPLLASTGDNDVARLPEYQLLQKQVEAARLQRKMEVGKNLPSVAVGAGLNYHNLLDNDRAFGMVFATVSVPLSDWWGGSHAIKRKRLAEQKAEQQLADNAELLAIRAQKAWNDVEEARAQLAVAQRSMEQAEENLRIHRNTYRAGTATMSDLLEAQLLQQQAADKHVDAYIDLQNAWLDYRQATGE